MICVLCVHRLFCFGVYSETYVFPSPFSFIFYMHRMRSNVSPGWNAWGKRDGEILDALGVSS